MYNDCLVDCSAALKMLFWFTNITGFRMFYDCENTNSGSSFLVTLKHIVPFIKHTCNNIYISTQTSTAVLICIWRTRVSQLYSSSTNMNHCCTWTHMKRLLLLACKPTSWNMSVLCNRSYTFKPQIYLEFS